MKTCWELEFGRSNWRSKVLPASGLEDSVHWQICRNGAHVLMVTAWLISTLGWVTQDVFDKMPERVVFEWPQWWTGEHGFCKRIFWWTSRKEYRYLQFSDIRSIIILVWSCSLLWKLKQEFLKMAWHWPYFLVLFWILAGAKSIIASGIFWIFFTDPTRLQSHRTLQWASHW